MDDLTALALRAADGDRLALGSFIRKTQADVWRTCRYLSTPSMADDLVQDTYIRAMDALPRFRADSSARTWIIGIARHTAMDAWRVKQRQDRLASALRRRRVIDLRDDHSSELDDIFARLAPDQAAAFHLTQVLGFTYAEAAEACDCKVGTIRSRVARARVALVEQLRSTEFDSDEAVD